MKIFILLSIIAIILQLLGFIPVYLKYRKDCKEIGKDKLSVSLLDRILYYLIVFPFWAMPLLYSSVIELYSKLM